jgi:hypothetical protein
MAVIDQSSFVAFLADLGSNIMGWSKASIANTAAGQLFSLWKAAGFPEAGATPTAWATCTSAQAGAVPLVNATAPAKLYLGHISATLTNVGSVQLFDRIAHMGGLSGTVTTAQPVNATIPTQRALAVDGSDAEWYLEWYSDTGSTATNATVTYTDGADVTGNTTVVALSATMRAGRLMRIPIASGHTIKSILAQRATSA